MDYDYNINYNKWNNYKIGDIHFINETRAHLSRVKFIDYISLKNYNTILEVGAGEAIEAQEIRLLNPDISYTIVDVSDVFLKNVRELGFNAIKAEMTNTGLDDKSFDLVYGSSILEHSPDIKRTIKELSRVSNHFYFTMFKWRFKTGNLESSYSSKMKCYSSKFNINDLFMLICEYGEINDLFVCTKSNEVVEYYQYLKQIGDIDRHRNGNYLSIVGKWYRS